LPYGVDGVTYVSFKLPADSKVTMDDDDHCIFRLIDRISLTDSIRLSIEQSPPTLTMTAALRFNVHDVDEKGVVEVRAV
jgi:hypothetical protein